MMNTEIAETPADEGSAVRKYPACKEAVRRISRTAFMRALADLSKYDLSGLRPVRFEFEKKSAQLNMRVPQALLEAVKKRSAARGIPYTRFIREAVESALSRSEKTK